MLCLPPRLQIWELRVDAVTAEYMWTMVVPIGATYNGVTFSPPTVRESPIRQPGATPPSPDLHALLCRAVSRMLR